MDCLSDTFFKRQQNKISVNYLIYNYIDANNLLPTSKEGDASKVDWTNLKKLLFSGPWVDSVFHTRESGKKLSFTELRQFLRLALIINICVTLRCIFIQAFYTLPKVATIN